MVRCLALLISLPLFAQVPPMPPHSKWETPAMKEARSIVESTASSPKDWLTVAERTSFRETGPYSEALDFYRRLEEASPFARLIEFGKTAEGRRWSV